MLGWQISTNPLPDKVRTLWQPGSLSSEWLSLSNLQGRSTVAPPWKVKLCVCSPPLLPPFSFTTTLFLKITLSSLLTHRSCCSCAEASSILSLPLGVGQFEKCGFCANKWKPPLPDRHSGQHQTQQCSGTEITSDFEMKVQGKTRLSI